MNVKLHTPKSLKAGSGIASIKQFLLSLFATSISIALTFGTAYLVDSRKKEAAKREMVMMIMYDMKETLSEVADCDTAIQKFFDMQMDLIAHPEKYETDRFHLMGYLPYVEFVNTTENIFKSNIETINTIGSILFVENVSDFYSDRQHYKKFVVDEFLDLTGDRVENYDSLANVDLTRMPWLSHIFYMLLENHFNECKIMMNISDEELDKFSEERKRLSNQVRSEEVRDSMEKANMKDLTIRRQRYQEALEQGRKAKK